MTTTDFITEIADILGMPAHTLTPETDLTAIPAWDSVAWLSSLVLIDEKLGAAVRPEMVSGARTLQDILQAVAHKLES